jgi:hypothetical protein
VPRHIRNIVIAALLAVLALAAGINGYVHHQFKTYIDNTLSSIRPFSQVKYSDLTTSLISGEVKLENVRIAGAFLPEEITLGNITLETPGFAYMLNGPANVKKGEFPKHLGFVIDDFYLDMHGETAEWLDRLVKRMQPIYASERKLCSGKSIFGPSDYKEMGYTRLLSNMRIAYNFSESNKTLDIDMIANTRNMGNLKASINVTNLSGMSSEKMMQGGVPQLANVAVTYKDETYTPRMVKYCSELSNMKKEEFVDAEIKQSDNYFYMVWGFAPGHGLREAYKDFLLKSDTVTLTMAPGKEFNPMTMATMSSNEIMEALNVNLKINGLVVTDLSFKMPPAEFTEKFEQRLANSLDFNSLLRGDPIKAPAPVKKPKVTKKAVAKYYKIKLSNVKNHVSDFVHITTKNGNQRNGQLIRLDKTNLYVQKKVEGGKFTMTVPREKIKTIEAYFSK